MQLATSAVTPETDYLIFPETSFGPLRQEDLGVDAITSKLKGFVDKHEKVKLVSGLTVYHVFKSGEERTDATRVVRRPSGDMMEYEMYNAAVQFAPGTDSVPLYKKSKLVPGAEFLPYRKVFFFLKPLIDKLEGSMAGYGKQEKRGVFVGGENNVGIGPAICYESVYGEYYAGYVRSGAHFTSIMTNDGWWDNTPGHIQHLKFASLRAIETRRPIARSANTGISAFINLRGDISQATKYGVEAVIRGEVWPNDGTTFYIRWGDMIGRLAVFLTAIIFLNSLAKQFMPKNEKA